MRRSYWQGSWPTRARCSVPCWKERASSCTLVLSLRVTRPVGALPALQGRDCAECSDGGVPRLPRDLMRRPECGQAMTNLLVCRALLKCNDVTFKS